MPFSLEDLAQQIAVLQAQVAAISPQSPQLNTLAQEDDVKLGNTGFPLTDLDVLTYIDADRAWENRPASAGSGFPVGPYDDGQATTEISVTPVDLGGGFWETLLQTTVEANGSPHAADMDDLSTVAVVDDGSGGPQSASDRWIRAGTTSNNTAGSLQLIATDGAAGVEASAELLAETGNYAGFSGPAPVPHVKVRSAFTSGTAPGTPMIGEILIESSAFGPCNIMIGGAQNDAVYMINLPTSDPGNPGQLYKVAGVLMVSP